MKAKVIAIANQKGGVGKTTTSVNLSAELTRQGYKTLLIDADGQCNSTDTCQAIIEDQPTLYDLLFGFEDALECIQKTSITDMIASDPLLNDSEHRFPNDAGRLFLLKNNAEKLREHYDYIIIDTPPNLGCMLGNILTYADFVIIPVTCDRYGMMGINELYNTIHSTQQYTNPKLKVLGVLFIKFRNNTILCREFSEKLPNVLNDFNTQLFDSKIRESESCRKAQSNCMSCFEYDPKSTTAADYSQLVQEIIYKAKGEQ